MSSKSDVAVRDILRHIALATGFVGSLDYDSFRNDDRTVYAITRCLEIISEASRRVSDDIKDRYPLIAWREMAGAGNVYRHNYEDVSARYVWQTVKNHLPALRDALAQELIESGDEAHGTKAP